MIRPTGFHVTPAPWERFGPALMDGDATAGKPSILDRQMGASGKGLGMFDPPAPKAPPAVAPDPSTFEEPVDPGFSDQTADEFGEEPAR